MSGQPSSGESKISQTIRRFGYTKSLLIVFVIPFLLLIRPIHRTVQKKPFYVTVAVVCLLGWTWSALLSYLGWWNFPEEFIVGIKVLPYVPLEEFIIYPIGGIFSVALYVVGARKLGGGGTRAPFWIFWAIPTAAFIALGIVKAETRPHYLTSQLVLYNGLCLVLAPVVAGRISLKGVLVSVSVLGTIGFIWDYAAFKYGWWVYHAITGVKILNIPIEDVNFYVMAPAAAIALYVWLCRIMKLDPVPPVPPPS